LKNAVAILQTVFLLLYFPAPLKSQERLQSLRVDFYGDSLQFEISMPDTITVPGPVTESAIQQYAACFDKWKYQPLTQLLLQYKAKQQLDDWLYYQLIRKTVQQISPKQNNYERYTIFKWFLLTRSGYDATLKTVQGRLLFYVQSNEDIFNIPSYFKNGKQYVCLNYHDYGYFDISNETFKEINLVNNGADRSFSYRVNRIPEGKDNAYVEKELQFNYYESINYFTIKLNPSIQQMFANYPTVDYASYFNIPLSRQTYLSLVPALKAHVQKMNTKKGVDFLMRFTRYAFLFESDTEHFGREKRLTPEQTLLYKYSDCEDRAALFFYLVKEIYDLPMIVLSYPKHISIAVKLNKPVGKPILYNGEKYTIAEPTSQGEDLALGKMLPSLKNTPFEVVYVYEPTAK
jgi:hypothetical protein